MPQVEGMSLKDAKSALSEQKFEIKVLGEGERRWHLMSSSARSGAANLVSVTSGTERERV